MIAHLRANLILVFGTLLLCAILYPAVLLGIGHTLFATSAAGSLVEQSAGRVVGSSLIAQPFAGDVYFHPRPSAVNFNGAGSGGSNWGTSNPRLRARAAHMLGPIVRFDTANGRDAAGKTVQQRIDEWFLTTPHASVRWANENPTLAAIWFEDSATAIAAWENSNPQQVAPDELRSDRLRGPAEEFFARFDSAHPGTWPVVEGGTLRPTRSGPTIHAYFFDTWLRDHPEVTLEHVPVDMVTASGSGLDPHITLSNARWQLRRVAEARARDSRRDVGQVRHAIDELLAKHAALPLGGLAGGEPLVNVLEINLALDKQLSRRAAK